MSELALTSFKTLFNDNLVLNAEGERVDPFNQSLFNINNPTAKLNALKDIANKNTNESLKKQVLVDEKYEILFNWLIQSLVGCTEIEKGKYYLMLLYIYSNYRPIVYTSEQKGTSFNVQTNSCNAPGNDDKTQAQTGDKFVADTVLNHDNILPSQAEAILRNFLTIHLETQFNKNHSNMEADANLRIRAQETALKNAQLTHTQQSASLAMLEQLSDYVNEQVGEYSAVYERLNTLIDTQKRKSTFQAGDVQTLDRWRFWCRVTFWSLISFVVVMVALDQFTDLSAFTTDMSRRLKSS